MDFDVVPYEDIVWGERIGGGSFGSVFKGQYLGIDIAIKEIHPSTQYDVHKYFEREWRILRECRHPNIVLFVGLSKEPGVDGRVFIVSEYIPRGNLRTFIRSGCAFPWRLRISFATDIARAVAYLHARQCIHRDLKGENMVITSNDRIKVADFGFARITGRNDEEMKHMTYCGTDGYMSPEILMGEEFDLPTDVYSLGIIFMEILTRILVGSKVYSRQAPHFIPDAKIVRQRASPGCPPAFIDLAIACCSLCSADRPSMPDVLAMLGAIELALPEIDTSEHVGSLRLRREGPRALPVFDRSTSVGSEVAAAAVDAQLGGLDDEEMEEEMLEEVVLDALVNADVQVGPVSGAVRPHRGASYFTQWSDDSPGSQYLEATEMQSHHLLLGSELFAAPSSGVIQRATIINVASMRRTSMPCSYPPSPPYETSSDEGSVCTIKEDKVKKVCGEPEAGPSMPQVKVTNMDDESMAATEPEPQPSRPSTESLSRPSTDTVTPITAFLVPRNRISSDGSSSGPSDASTGPSEGASSGSSDVPIPSPRPSPSISRRTSNTGRHRFTLVHRDPPALLNSKRVPSSLAANLARAFLPRTLTGPKDKCPVCSKRLGPRAALQCDDCGILVHAKCSAEASRNCTTEEISIDE